MPGDHVSEIILPYTTNTTIPKVCALSKIYPVSLKDCYPLRLPNSHEDGALNRLYCGSALLMLQCHKSYLSRRSSEIGPWHLFVVLTLIQLHKSIFKCSSWPEQFTLNVRPRLLPSCTHRLSTLPVIHLHFSLMYPCTSWHHQSGKS